ncbi:TetR family transcriptional regulator [Isoptericola jiangsuensis]|uniref:TetR family transcriptional regulator n=1 Tax=Isoptericola jiangsuensis TaxID=548579 RepID=A0A2A9ERM8_9MICO|nr:TetR/AcrR family transcriptional regulator [Isoptericola jiangsuensis]PFG41654.1 TetR family transcriptional regulator [Isoptericola jiangsuensis]
MTPSATPTLPVPARPARAAIGDVASEPAGRRPGRPRVEGHDERILAAAVELLDAGEDVTVGRVVARSGVSRAAIYRRWPSLTDLVAAALDHGREPYAVPLDGDLLENLLTVFAPGSATAGPGYSEERFRLRLRLALSDRRLARAYWRSHVARRRPGLEAVLRAGIERGELRADLDLDACMDLLTGVVYYQYVVRGESLDDPQVVQRCRTAIRVAWQGMQVGA